jgi:tetratricopeptide (TPR) repeat protein
MNLIKQFQKAQELYRAGNLPKAMDVCFDILEIAPHDINSMSLLGTMFYELKNYDSSIEICNELLRLNPFSVHACYIVGICLQRKGCFSESIEHLQKAMDFNPEKASEYNTALAISYISLATSFQEKGQSNEALICFEKANKLAPVDQFERFIYVNKKKETLLFANLKCGYSSLEFYRNAGKIDRWEKDHINGYYKIAMVRNPYERIESFFKNKLIQQMSSACAQICQQRLRCFFPTNRLIKKEVSFEEFIIALNRGYTDEHLVPQYLNIPTEVDTLVHLEKLEELKLIKEKFDIDFAKYNNTDDMNIELVWTDEMQEIIQKLYFQDFLVCGYDMGK